MEIGTYSIERSYLSREDLVHITLGRSHSSLGDFYRSQGSPGENEKSF
jgi:hypothetical protein